jgi:glycosyl transferase family 25
MAAELPIFLINLERRPDRLALMQDRLPEVRFKRIPAVDGRSLRDDEVARLLAPVMQYAMSKNEVGCLLSHRAVWQRVVEQQLRFACVLEDDVQCSRDFARFMQNADWLPDRFDLIKIETMLQTVLLSRRTWPAKDRALARLRSPHFGTAGYVLSQAGAAKLLELTEAPDRAADDLLFSVGLEAAANLRVLQLVPALCVQDFVLSGSTTESDIAGDRSGLRQKRRLPWHRKLVREVKRPFGQVAGLLRRVPNRRTVVPYA